MSEPAERPEPGPHPARSPKLRAVPGAALDTAHVGDIEGALGRIRADEQDERRGLRRRLLTFLAIVGPGLIVMVGDNDAGGVSTYSQSGQNYGYSLMWVLLLLIPVLIVNQEMVVRLGAVTGVGHARLINERFGRFWGWFSFGDLFLLNFLTITTEFIGISLALAYFGISKYIAVPAAAALIAITTTGSFPPLGGGHAAVHRLQPGPVPAGVPVPPRLRRHRPPSSGARHPGRRELRRDPADHRHRRHHRRPLAAVLPAVQRHRQAHHPRFIGYERADTFLGAVVVVTGAGAMMIAGAYAVAGTPLAGHFTDALGVARALQAKDQVLGALFAIVLLDASIIGAAAVTLSTSYAFGDFFGLKHSLHRSFRDARAFYTTFTLLVILAAGIVLIPGTPLGVVTEAVQALAGLLLPSASVFLLLLCNDREVLGPWVNRGWLNVVATVIIATLLMLSGTLMATTMFPHVNAARMALWLSVALAAGLAATGIVLWVGRSRRPAPQTRPQEERAGWRMPPLAMLKPVTWSPALKIAMLALRGYLVIAALLLLVKAIQLGTG